MLMSALGSDHIVGQGGVHPLPPAYTTLYVDFRLPAGEIAEIREILAREHETTRTYTVELQDKDGVVYAVVERTIYIANKKFYKQKTQGGDTCIASPEGESPP